MLQIFTVYDEKSEAYLNPFFLPNIAVAQRALMDCLRDPQHQFSQHTADYTLYRIGTFEQSTGTIKPEHKLINTLLQLNSMKDHNDGDSIQQSA